MQIGNGKTSLTDGSCGGAEHLTRRSLLKGAAGLMWLTPMAEMLALDAELGAKKGKPAKSVILVWLAGGASQLETFDPHPGSKIAYGSKAIDTAVKGVEVGEGLAQTAEVMGDLTLVRSMVSKEGDHERAMYNMKTGYRPTPSLVHPAIGAALCHELPGGDVEIPSHVSILPGAWPSRGGYLGAEFDAFKTGDPMQPVPDLQATVEEARMAERMKSLSVVERAFARGRAEGLDERVTLHNRTIEKGRRMMTSDQVDAFDLSQVPKSELEVFGDSAFGLGCLAAVRLVEVGVRCVEVTLGGWDTHLNNHELQAARIAELDPALASLVKTLKARGLYESTVVICASEFGRTPKLNALEGRDHWPHSFSVAIGGGGIRGGQVIGETDPEGSKEKPADAVGVADLHATVYEALGVDPETELMTPVGRPMTLSEGEVVEELLG